MLLGTYQMFDETVLEDRHFLAVASAIEHANTASHHDVHEELMPHVNHVDYAEIKSLLLPILGNIPASYCFPGEPLGITNRVRQHIALQPDCQWLSPMTRFFVSVMKTRHIFLPYLMMTQRPFSPL